MSKRDSDSRRQSMNFTMGELDIDATLDKDDYTNIDFIFRNLNITNDFLKDSTFSIDTRSKISDITSIQFMFYIFCALKISLLHLKAPRILVVGIGYMGTKIVNSLISYGLGEYIKLYIRNEDDLTKWRAQGIRCDVSLKLLYKKDKPDIIIICTPISSFSLLAKQLKILIDNTTLIIYATVGLQRRRVMETFQTPNILRSYIESSHQNKLLRAKYSHDTLLNIQNNITKGGIFDVMYEKFNDMANHRQTSSSTIGMGIKTFRKPKLPTTIEDEGDNSDRSSDSSEFDEGEEEKLLIEELAADYIGKRAMDIRNFIYLIENYYALNGMSHPMARYEALLSILGYNDDDYDEYIIKKNEEKELSSDNRSEIYSGVNSSRISSRVNSAKTSARSKIEASRSTSDVSNANMTKINRMIDKEPLLNKLSQIMSIITEKVGLYFQKQFSKYIKVIHIPKVSNVIERLQESSALASIALSNNGIAGLASFVNGLNPTIQEKKTLEDMIMKMNKGYDDNDFVDTYDVNGVIIKLGYDGSGYAMHNTNIISKIFDQDRKYNIVDNNNQETNILNENIDDQWLEDIDHMLDIDDDEDEEDNMNNDDDDISYSNTNTSNGDKSNMLSGMRRLNTDDTEGSKEESDEYSMNDEEDSEDDNEKDKEVTNQNNDKLVESTEHSSKVS